MEIAGGPREPTKKSKTGVETNETPERIWQEARPDERQRGRVLTKEEKEEEKRKTWNENEENNRETEGWKGERKRERVGFRRKEKEKKKTEGCCMKEIRTIERRGQKREGR